VQVDHLHVPIAVRSRSGPSALDVEGLDALLAQLPFTSRRRWLQAWADTHPDWDPWLVTVEDGGLLVAAAPLARRRRGPLCEVVLLGHGPTDDARLPARTSAAAQALADAVLDGLKGAWRLRLQQVPVDDPVVAALAARLRHVRLDAAQGMPLVRIGERDLNGYLSKNTRKALAKISNRLKAAGLEPELRWTRDPDEVVALLPELERVHRERDLELGRRPDHDDPQSAAFYRTVIERHARAGEVDLLTLRLDGDLAAFVCGFRDGRALRSWDNRLSPRWAELSAGRIANTEALRHVVQGGEYDALDWMRGEEPYKLQSATEVVPTAVLTAWSALALRRADELGVRAAAAARTSPHLTRVGKRVRALR